jgi:predicted amidophosphoribosyltransferase
VPVCRGCMGAAKPLTAEFFCRLCQTPFQNEFALDESGTCSLCRSEVRGFDAAYCFGNYENTLRHLIHLFKYNRFEPLAKPLAAMLVRALPHEERFDAVACVPMHWRKRLRRGFNQAEFRVCVAFRT